MTEIDLITELLQENGAYAQERYACRDEIVVDSKTDANDILTEVDLAIQERIVARVRDAFPSDTIVAEEAGLSDTPDSPAGRCWLIDPIDGTQNFVRGMFPGFGVSIGFARDGVPVAGGVTVPMAGITFLAEKGSGATMNGQPAVVAPTPTVSVARAEIDFSHRVDRKKTLEQTSRFIEAVGQVRCHCAAVIGLCSIVSGDMDIFVHVNLNPWDFAAAMVIVQEAGGRVTHFDGRPLQVPGGRVDIIASNGIVHDEVIRLLD